MKKEENRKTIITILNVVVIVLTIAVIVTGISCLAAAERAKKELADVQTALDELRSAAPLDQYWTAGAIEQGKKNGGLREDTKTVFLTCKRAENAPGELILVSSDSDYSTMTFDGEGKAVRELDRMMEDYLLENEGNLVVLVSRDRFSGEELTALEEMLGERVGQFAG